MLPGTAQAWLEAITDGKAWEQGRDADRIAAAFRTLARTARRWPVPAEFLDVLPPVADLPALGYESKPVTPEQAAENIARLKAMLSGVVLPVPPVKIDRKRAAGGPDA